MIETNHKPYLSLHNDSINQSINQVELARLSLISSFHLSLSSIKSRVALQQDIVPVSCPARVSGEDFGLQDVGSVHEAINQIY